MKHHLETPGLVLDLILVVPYWAIPKSTAVGGVSPPFSDNDK